MKAVKSDNKALKIVGEFIATLTAWGAVISLAIVFVFLIAWGLGAVEFSVAKPPSELHGHTFRKDDDSQNKFFITPLQGDTLKKY